ncbi:carboxymuconolactone decarboxylase family protein [Streptomyces antimycoticus]|uniref:Alkyl hydroperoxide reductase AhpD n=1 Tax=Streptomyces antimycoticus TaxID=68175 RepID=A0A4D4KP26_9ACTN|nr:carboxymuconolactone decarboxylase family protein [Streptomyces antimycoticus]GDY48646.1 alkyl hydroperoxide reductase AhpD [Streptomyces antimycoticus]
MSRLTVPAPDDVPAGAQSTLDTIGAQFGFVPNMFTTLASNPTVLDVVMSLQGALSRVLDAKTRHTIALAVSQANGCDDCLAIHTYVSSELGGMSSDDIDLARAGSSIDPKRAAVARFAQQVVDSRGQVSDADLAAVRGAGYTDPQILAIVTVAVQVLLTNFLNNVNQTDIDIPAVNLGRYARLTAGTPVEART